MWNTTCLTFFTKYLLGQHCCFARTWFRFLVTCHNVLQSCYNMPLLEGSIFIIKTLFLERYIANRKQTYWKNKVLMSNGGVGYGQAWNWLSYQDEYSKKSHRIALKEIFHKYNFYAYSYPYSRIQRIKRTTRSSYGWYQSPGIVLWELAPVLESDKNSSVIGTTRGLRWRQKLLVCLILCLFIF